MRRVGPGEENLSEQYWAARPKEGFSDGHPFQPNATNAHDPRKDRDYADPQRPPITVALAKNTEPENTAGDQTLDATATGNSSDLAYPNGVESLETTNSTGSSKTPAGDLLPE